MTRWDPKNPVAPFDRDGSLQHYPLNSYRWDEAAGRNIAVGPEWRAVNPFVATMTLRGTARGRSAAYFVWEDDEGRTWPMFMADVADLVQRGTVIGGKAHGPWTVRKRGANYGLALAAA